MKCLGCFKSTKYIYCPKCKKELFDNQKIDFKLDFDKKEFLSTKIELSDKMSISGVQDKIALKIEDNKHLLFEEQKSIASLFSNLDHLITLQQQSLEKLKTLKKAFLEKMFV